jgi:hypothetical protein
MANYRCGGPTGIACLTMLTLLGCSRHASDTRAQMQWAHDALARNDSIEVVAEDPTSRTFTVRVKSSGELRMVHADEMIASPAALGAATDQPAATARALAAGAPAAAAAASSPAAPSTASTEPPPMPEPPPPPAVQPSTLASQTAAASSGRVLESGPGYSITAGSAGATSGARLRDANVTTAVVERRHEPIVCQGERLVHIDNRNLIFDGDAVSAEDGCEIHITNSHISAQGVGISARHANVHIDNSVIEGGQASIDASEGAQVYAASSQFRGLSRRLDTAAFHDLGGNIWN